MSNEYMREHPTLASVVDFAVGCVATIITCELIVGCAQGAAWLIGQVI